MRRPFVPPPRRSAGRRGILLLALLLSTSAAHARPQAAEKAPPRIRASVDVTVLDLDFVATKDGRPVHDLRRDELVVKVGGRVLPVDLFARVEASRIAPPSAAAGEALPPGRASEAGTVVPRQLLVYFDDARLQPWQRRPVIDGLEGLFARLGPADEASIVSYNGGTLVLAPFTNDRARLADGLARLRDLVPRGLHRASLFRTAAAAMETEDRIQRSSSGRNRPANLKDSILRTWVEEERTRTLAGLAELRRTVSALAARPGKRRMVLVTTGWERMPGQTLAQLGFGRDTWRQFDTSTWKETEAILRAANRSGVTIDVVDAKGFESELDIELSEMREVGKWIARLNTRDGMATIAETTGGAFVENVSFYERALGEIWRESSDYYSVGVTLPEALPAGKVLKVHLSCSRPGVTLRTRSSVGARSDAEAARDLAESALLAPPPPSAFAVRLELGAPRPDGFLSRRRVTPWRVLVPGGELTFSPDGDRRSAVVEVAFAAIDDSGGRSEVAPERFDISVPAARLAETAGRDLPLSGLLRTRTGRHRIVATVRDVASGRTAVATVPLVDD
jgi:VWFA-related protein